MPKPKVIILGKLPPPFMGPAIATRIILNSTLNEAFELIHLDTTINREIASMGRWKTSKMWKNIAIYFKLFGLIIKHRPQAVLVPVSQTTMGFLKDAIFLWIAGLTFRKTIIQLRGSNWKNWLNEASGLTRFFVNFTLKLTAGVIVLGNNLRHLFEANYSADKIFVVPNGANYIIPKRKRNSEQLEVLYFANLLPSKGIFDVLQAIKILTEIADLPSFYLKAVGAWDNANFEAQCTNYIKQHQLPVQIESAQSGAQKFQTFADADLFVFTPEMPEGHPWVIVEAMASALPIIATDQGAIIESVIHEKNGFIVPVNEPESIANRLALLLRDPDLRKQMAGASRKQYDEHFTEAHMVANLGQTLHHITGTSN